MTAVRIYTKPGCPYCEAAAGLLRSLDLPFEETDVQKDPDLRARLSAENGNYPTVPMIFLGDEFVGGYTELQALHDRGELVPRVDAILSANKG